MKKFYTVLLIFALSAGLLLTAAACGHKEEEPPIAEIQPEPEPVPQIPVDDPQLPGAFLVMIDNMEDARPQSGLDKADVVFEIEAEGGITRYMALFYNNGADKIGPCRSARYYFAELAKGLDAVYAHVGGSTDGYSTIRQLKLQDIDGIRATAQQFWRSKDRKAPHNCYTSTDILVEIARKRAMN